MIKNCFTNGLYKASILLAMVILLVTYSCEVNPPKFNLLTNSDIGINFENKLEYTEEFNAYLFRSFYNGAGIGLADMTNDGNLDLFLCGNQVDNKLYLGNGNFEFTDVTDHAGVASTGSWTTGVSIADINGDGWKDIYVCKSGRLDDANRRNELFIHQGLDKDGLPSFVESAKMYGIDDLGFSIHAVFFDYDRDGDLDMYLSNNSNNPTDVILNSKKGMREKKDPGGGNKLYRNENNHFTDVTEEAGIYSSSIGFGLGIAVGDLNRDGWPDIYVANDFFEKDYLYINQGNGTFSEIIEDSTTEISLGSMGVDIADMNHDGLPDIFVTEMLPDDEGRRKTKALFDSWDMYSLKVDNGYHHQFPRNTFQINKGKKSGQSIVGFSEISRYAGVEASDWSWGVQMMDLDNDGNKEIFITNGIRKDLLDHDYLDFYDNPEKLRQILNEKGEVMTELLDNMPSQPISNYLYHLDQNLVYKNVAVDFGLDQPGFSSGAAYGDIDNDGDLDLVVNNIDSPPFIYKNNLNTENNHYVALDLKNRSGNIAIGAQVSLWADDKLYFEELYSMKGSMSVIDDRLHIGLGETSRIDSLEIMWPDGSVQWEKDIPIDRISTIKQSSNTGLAIKVNTDSVAIKSRTPGLSFAHKENAFVDFDRDNLLFQMISNEGPKIAVGDINGDGLEDCYIGGAKDQVGALFVQRKSSFIRTNEALLDLDKASEDQHAIFFDADNDGDSDLLVSSGSNEFSSSSFDLIDRLYFNDGKGQFYKSEQVLPTVRPSSTSVIVHFDYDEDGDEDLFFGSRLVPGLYGVPASSFLLENQGDGQFLNVTERKALGLLNLGMVTDATKTDVDLDGDDDLVVVGEWMPLKIYINENGVLNELSETSGLNDSNGFWNSIRAEDIDNDGDEDLIVGNIGENSFFKASLEKPLRMYVNDFDKNGKIEQIITTYRGEKAFPVILKKDITKQMPHLLKKYLKHDAYKEQTIEDIFTEKELENALVYQIFETGSCIFWNHKGRFTKQKLPFEAQLAPIYAIHTVDVNDDGKLDILLGGNQFRAKPQVGIYAATDGIALLNEGGKDFSLFSNQDFDFNIEGQIRDIKGITIGSQEHLLIARNNDSLKLLAIE